MRESRYRTSLSSTKFFLDCEDILDLSSRSVLCAITLVSRRSRHDHVRVADLLPTHPRSPNPYPSRSSTCTVP